MNTKQYQLRLSELLKMIFPEEDVKLEWDSLRYDTHGSNHKGVYGPKLDAAIGPFNGMVELDTPLDNTGIMKNHIFTKRIVKEIGWDKQDFETNWNDFSRCYLAIEIEFGRSNKSSNSLKHILGSIINASVSGSVGIIVTDKYTEKKVNRLYFYLLRLRNYGLMHENTLQNLVQIDKDYFLEVIQEVYKSIK